MRILSSGTRRVHRRHAALATALLLWMGASAVQAQTAPDTTQQQGRYAALAGDCAACHTSDPARPFAGGRAINSPMGQIFASNITPSKVNGIGGYTEAQFAAALREGINAKGEHLYPAMPYTAYAGISDADMHALYEYFMHDVQPVDQPVQTTRLSFPFNLRFSMAFWNALYLKQGKLDDGAGAGAQADRGKYLVDTLGHCSSCHSPRNTLMAERGDAYLGGALIDGWIAPNITSDPVSGIGAWSTEELAGYLKNGHVKGKGQAGGGMAEAIEQSLRHLSDSDLNAIATYLKTVKPIRDAGDQKAAFDYSGDGSLPPLTEREVQQADPRPAGDATTTDGATLYNGACASCHQDHGNGTAGQYFPSLSHNRAVGLNAPNNIVMAILHGIDRQGADAHVLMPAFGNDLNDAQVASITNYVNQHFGNPSVHTTADAVAQIRHGGPTPLLLRLMPWFLGVGAVVLLLIVVLVLRAMLGRRRTRR